MIFDISKAFIDRPASTELSSAAWERIISAYKKAKETELAVPDVYRPSLIWSKIYYGGYMSESMEALSVGDITVCKKIFGNFFREKLSTGLIGFSLNMPSMYMSTSQQATPEDINEYFYFNKNRIEKLLLMQPALDISKLIKPNIGNPYGYELDGNFINICSEAHFNYSSTISKMLRSKSNPRILELGGGYGGLAYYLNRDVKNIKYTGIDLPENLALQTFYLMSAFPDKTFYLYGEQETTDQVDIALLPGFESEKFRENDFDLFFNSYSLAEMDSETVANYLKIACETTRGCLYHINVNNSNSHTNADGFPIDFRKFELFLRYSDVWSGTNAEGSGTEVNEYIYIANNTSAI